jgi:hypothetical protein
MAMNPTLTLFKIVLFVCLFVCFPVWDFVLMFCLGEKEFFPSQAATSLSGSSLPPPETAPQ